MSRYLKAIEWAGCITGLLGAFFLALNLSFSGIGFILFLLSNLFWTAYAIGNRSLGLLVMQCGFMTTSILGIIRWLI
jgi:drug/metabolite transporter (DMT)-like permease